MKKFRIPLLILCCIFLLPLVGCVTGIGHSQGEMTGEVTMDSAILQSRLTAICKTQDCELHGTQGVARFEISTDPEFTESSLTEWITAESENDFMIKKKVAGLTPGTCCYYRLLYGQDVDTIETGPTCTFRTLDPADVASEVSFVVVTGMCYFKFHIFPGPSDRHLGYPGLETIQEMNPDFFVGTGDNVYYDAYPLPRKTQETMRQEWHKQFIQPRFVSLFSQVPTYWEKDDHDFRYNDADTTGDLEPSTELGIRTFLEQVPVVDPDETDPVTYRTIRINKLLQIWLTEGRDYRSSNMIEDGPEKTLWGETQKAWLKETLLASDATFKILISPTPMIGPDDMTMIWPAPGQDDKYRRDCHADPMGFKHEGKEFFGWLADNGFLDKNFYIICGDRHWKYHSIRPDGFEEFSCGALIDANSRLGIAPGDPNSTDPEGLIDQPYTAQTITGGFLKVTVRPGEGEDPETCEFSFYDENGVMLYTTTRSAN